MICQLKNTIRTKITVRPVPFISFIKGFKTDHKLEMKKGKNVITRTLYTNSILMAHVITTTKCITSYQLMHNYL